jgi:Tol biopolymer transport system component
MKSIALLLGLLLLQAQAPPSTDIFLVDVSFQKSPPTIGRPLNVTVREGYDNQPMFLPDGGSFFYTSIREGRPTDIYRYTDRVARRRSRDRHHGRRIFRDADS